MNERDGLAGPSNPDDDLFRELYPSLRRFAAGVGPTRQDPDDLLQEAVARALKHGPLSELESPGPYLKRTIVRLAADGRRAAWRFDRLLSLVAREQMRRGSSGSTNTDLGALDVLDELSPIDRALLVLTVVEGYGLDDAAEQLGLSYTAARARSLLSNSGERLAFLGWVSNTGGYAGTVGSGSGVVGRASAG